MMNNLIDTGFDFRTDSYGKDPDAYSETLRRYHGLLWSKPLPNGKSLLLDEDLVNTSDAGKFSFSSDSIIHTFSQWKRYQHIISQIPAEEIEYFKYKSYTIGGMTIFPNNTVGKQMTINKSRGLNRAICDRIDLTLECIRLFYQKQDSPLFKTFSIYSDFFDLFGDFKGYVDFFLFQDLVSDDYEFVRFFYPFTEFGVDVLPKSKEEYLSYKDNAIAFVDQRNQRIAEWGEINIGSDENV